MTAWKNTINLQAVADEVHDKAAHGLFLAAEHVLQVSNTKVPHEEGTLERSGTTSVDAQQLRAAMSYDTPYAVRQHEDMSARHDEGRTAKYLENAMNGEKATVARIIAGEIRRGT